MATVFVLGSFAESLINFRGPLLRELRRRGHRVLAGAPAIDAATRARLEALDVEAVDVPLSRTGMNPLRDLASLRALTRIFRAVRPDAVLSYTIKPVIYGSLAARRAGVPAVYAMITGLGHSFARDTFRQRLIGAAARVLYRRALRGTRRVFFQNPDDRADFLSMGLLRSEDQAVLINGSGVELEHFAPAPPPERLACLLVARLIREKGIREYAEAARCVRAERPEVAFRLAGWFDENPHAIDRREVDAWVRDGDIEYLGRLDDVRPALAECAVYVLPSYYREGTPRTVLEAMAVGRPIMTTDWPGCRETVEPGVNGVTVPVRDPAALAAALRELLADPARLAAMGAASRRMAEAKYDVHKVNAAILDAMAL